MSSQGIWESYSARFDVGKNRSEFPHGYLLYDGSMNVSLTTPMGISIYFEGNWFYSVTSRPSLDLYANEHRALYLTNERITFDAAINANREAEFKAKATFNEIQFNQNLSFNGADFKSDVSFNTYGHEFGCHCFGSQRIQSGERTNLREKRG